MRLMGILNATPDSFSDGGMYLEPAAAIAHGRELAERGASILDVGGESTRPGSATVSAEVEIERVGPVLAGLAGVEAEISIDTSKAAVAETALDAGATIVNDVTALRGDPEMAALCADRGPVVVLMHMPASLRAEPPRSAVGDVVAEVRDFLAERIEAALAAGIAEERIWVDPGIGFGKVNPEGNLELLRRLGELRALGRPIVVGTSRKSFIGEIDGSAPAERLGGTIASSLLAAREGADVLRVHDVREVAEALRTAAAVDERA
jgi:dihydropteroate synthase